MLYLRSHTSSLRQRWLIVVGILGALGAFAILASIYEARYRGPDESALFGTWQCVENCIPKPYAPFPEGEYCFKPDHSFTVLAPDTSRVGDPVLPVAFGRWYAGGRFIYFRLPGPWFEEIPIREIGVWRIEDIGPTELRVKLGADKPPRLYRRVGVCAPNASNKSLEPTAGRSVASRRMISCAPAQGTLAIASGGSAPAR